jgi:hypothetical protein
MDISDGLPEEAIYENRRLRIENEELQRRLDKSAAKIMTLQGGADQITDTDVKKKFEGLCGAIQEWVTDVELDFVEQSRDFIDGFFKTRHEQERSDLLRDLFLREEYKDDAGKLTLDRGNRDFGGMRWLAKVNTCIYVVLSRLIWCRLSEHIFERPYPLGTDDAHATGFNYMIKAIEAERDGKGSYNIYWAVITPRDGSLLRVQQSRSSGPTSGDPKQ